MFKIGFQAFIQTIIKEQLSEQYGDMKSVSQQVPVPFYQLSFEPFPSSLDIRLLHDINFFLFDFFPKEFTKIAIVPLNHPLAYNLLEGMSRNCDFLTFSISTKSTNVAFCSSLGILIFTQFQEEIQEPILNLLSSKRLICYYSKRSNKCTENRFNFENLTNLIEIDPKYEQKAHFIVKYVGQGKYDFISSLVPQNCKIFIGTFHIHALLTSGFFALSLHKFIVKNHF